jgi:hypothetical protein
LKLRDKKKTANPGRVCSAHDVARKDKRQTISGADVVAAMAELDFAEFTETLEACLQGIKKKNIIFIIIMDYVLCIKSCPLYWAVSSV